MSQIYKNSSSTPVIAIETLSAETGPPTGPLANNFNFSGQIAAYPTGTQTVTFSLPSLGIMHADAVFPHWDTLLAGPIVAQKSQGYLVNSAGNVSIALPPTPSPGDSFSVAMVGVGTFTITENIGDSIQLGSDVSTATTGTLQSIDQGDSVTLVCFSIGIGNGWIVTQSLGNITIT